MRAIRGHVLESVAANARPTSICVPMLPVCAALMRRGSVNDLANAIESRTASRLSTTTTPGSCTSDLAFGSRSMLYCVPNSARG